MTSPSEKANHSPASCQNHGASQRSHRSRQPNATTKLAYPVSPDPAQRRSTKLDMPNSTTRASVIPPPPPLSSSCSGWDMIMEDLTNYYEKHGHVKIDNNDVDQVVLMVWIAQQKQYHEKLFNGGAAMPLDSERLFKLDRLGFFHQWWTESNPLWNPQWYERSWDFMHGALLVFLSHNKDSRIEQGPNGEFSLLSAWSEHYKNYYSKVLSGETQPSSLDSDRMAKLASFSSFAPSVQPDAPREDSKPHPKSISDGSAAEQLDELQSGPGLPNEISFDDRRCDNDDDDDCGDSMLSAGGVSKADRELVGLPTVSFDWVLDLDKLQFRSRCRGFEKNKGRCLRGYRCSYSHVFSKDRARIPRLPPPGLGKDRGSIQTLCRHNSAGELWHTCAYIYKNVVVLVFGGNGVQSDDGVHWYRTEDEALDALNVLVLDHKHQERIVGSSRTLQIEADEETQRVDSSPENEKRQWDNADSSEHEQEEKQPALPIDLPLSHGRKKNSTSVVDVCNPTAPSPKNKKRLSMVGTSLERESNDICAEVALDSPLRSARRKSYGSPGGDGGVESTTPPRKKQRMQGGDELLEHGQKEKPAIVVGRRLSHCGNNAIAKAGDVVAQGSEHKPESRFTPKVSSNWLTEIRKDVWKECRFYKKNNRCLHGKECDFAHVRRDGKIGGRKTSIDEWNMKIIHRRDPKGELYYTTGLVQGNKFIYAIGGDDGEQCPESGIWFYPSAASAREALLRLFK